MIWLVWCPDRGETDADARGIDAQDCVDACEVWARRDGQADPAVISAHLSDGLDLRARTDCKLMKSETHRVMVEAEATVHYSARRVKEGAT